MARNIYLFSENIKIYSRQTRLFNVSTIKKISIVVRVVHADRCVFGKMNWKVLPLPPQKNVDERGDVTFSRK
jgi:hypothetical protein